MPKAEAKKNKYLSYLLRLVVAAGALYLAFIGEDLAEVGRVFLGVKLWVFAGSLAVYAASQLIFVSRWYLLLRVQSIEIGYWPAVRLHFLGLFYNNCLPSAVGGDLLRAWYVTKHTDKKLEAALSVFVDRAIGLTGMFIMAFFCYWFIPAEDRGKLFDFPYAVGFLQKLTDYKWIILAAGVIVAIAVIVFMLSEKGRGLLRRIYAVISQRGAEALSKVNVAIRIYLNKKPALFLALLLTFSCQVVAVISVWLIGREIGAAVSLKYYMVFFPISWLLGTLPISVGGAGVMELWLKKAFIQMCGIPSKNALVLALCQRIIWLFGSLPGAVIHLVGAHLPKDFFIDCKKPIT